MKKFCFPEFKYLLRIKSALSPRGSLWLTNACLCFRRVRRWVGWGGAVTGTPSLWWSPALTASTRGSPALPGPGASWTGRRPPPAWPTCSCRPAAPWTRATSRPSAYTPATGELHCYLVSSVSHSSQTPILETIKNSGHLELDIKVRFSKPLFPAHGPSLIPSDNI